MNSAAHVAIALLGVYFVVSGVSALSGLPESFAVLDRESFLFVWAKNPTMMLSIRLIAILLFRIAPGVLLIRYRVQIVERVLPDSAKAAASLRPSEFYVVGCVLLAVYFGLTGLSGTIGGSVAIVGYWFSSDFFFAGSLGPLIGSLVRLAAAALLYRHAKSRGAILATSPIPEPIIPREHTCRFCEQRFTSLEPAWDQLLKTRRCPRCAQPLDL